MNSVSARLQVIFANLKTTDLVATKVANEVNIDKFRKILNRAASVTDEEISFGECIRFMHRSDPTSFLKYLHLPRVNMVHLVLLTDGYPITLVLGLRDIVVIRWDRQMKEFNVTTRDGVPSLKSSNNTESGIPSNVTSKRGDNHNISINSRDNKQRPFPRGQKNNNKVISPRADRVITPLSSEQCVEIINSTKPKPTQKTKLYASALNSICDNNTSIESPKPSWDDFNSDADDTCDE